MKKHEIKVGGKYLARVGGKHTTVLVNAIRERDDYNGRTTTVYNVTNLATGRKTTFRSAAKFRSEVVNPQNGNRGTTETTVPPSPPSTSETEKCRVCKEAFTTDLVGRKSERNPAICVSCEGLAIQEECEAEEGEHSADPTTPSTNGALGAVSQPGSAGVMTQSLGIASSLAARIAQQTEPATDAKLTEQQRDILATAREVEAGNGQRVLVIGAGAGTGKTFTLKQLEQVLRGNGQYTAFNASLVAESKAKFKRAACNTTHSLAFRAVGCKFKHRIGGRRVRSWEIAQRLGIEDYAVELPEAVAPYDDGKPQIRRLKASFLAGQVTEAIRRFCQSADESITEKHFKRFDGLDESGKYDNSNKVKAYLLPFARKAWTDLADPNGSTMPFQHDHYVKLWEMGRGKNRPVIAADYILLDEAQDTAPVMLSILKQQTHAMIVLVGDDNQQIYEWRGAVNAMASFEGAPRRLLSQSFRFGQAVADVANAVLSGLEQPTDLVMRGLESIPTRVCEVKEPKCYLYRTNAGAIGRLMNAMDSGKKAHLIGGSAEVVQFCKAARDLQEGRTTNHPELGCFTTWTEVQAYVKEDEGADLKLMVKLIDDFGAERIIKALENMPPEDKADIVISTAHKSKGREWASVRLGQDFKTKDKLDDAERRLLYVAVTRAQEELDISQCPPFCGGNSGKNGFGPNPEEQMWVPGIEINYTVPMPSAEKLEEYRAGRKKETVKETPATPTAVTKPDLPMPAAEPIRQIVASTTERVVTYTKLPSGEWGLWASAKIESGETVEVRMRSGARKKVKVGRIVSVNEQAKKWLATIA